RVTAGDITSAGSACRLRLHWVAIPYIPSRQPHRCRTAWTSFCSPVFCEENQLSSFDVRVSTSRYQRTLILFWKDMSNLASCAPRDHLAITRATTLPSRITPYFI